MTMYEGENDIPEETTSVPEVDCLHTSCTPSIMSNGHTLPAKRSNSGSWRPNTVHFIPSTSKRATHRVSCDEERSVDTLCEQLNSVEMVDSDTRPAHHPISECGATLTNGAHQEYPAVEDVFAQDRDGDTLLHMAIIHLKSVLALLFINMCPSYTWLNLRNHLYQTALHLATATKQAPIVRRLIVGGADIEARDHSGNTPLHIAARDGFLEGVEALMEPVRYYETKLNKYDIPYQRIPQNLEIINYEGLTALHLAAANGHLDIVKLLIDKRADVNNRDVKNGRSILHKACSDGNASLVRLLLKCKDCDINIRTYDDFTPFDFARARAFSRITYELAVAGARYADENEEYD